jgi:hypothetical protein
MTDKHNKFKQRMDTAERMMPMLLKTHKIDKGIEVISATNGYAKQFHIGKVLLITGLCGLKGE